jgi:hypothetical protein
VHSRSGDTNVCFGYEYHNVSGEEEGNRFEYECTGLSSVT